MISIVFAVASGNCARSSSVIGMTDPSASSYPLPISAPDTSSPSSSHTLR